MNVTEINTGRLPGILAAAAMVLTLASCSWVIEEPAFPPAGGEVAVAFTLQVPGAGAPRASRALSVEQESRVTEIDVLAFDPLTGDFVYRAGCSGTQITGAGNSKTLTLQLRPGTFDLMVLANSRSILAPYDDMLFGFNRDEITGMLETAMPAENKWAAGTQFPMWGEKGAATVNRNTSFTGENGVKLTRMVARVDVKVAAAVGNFKLTAVDVYNGSTHGRLVPDPQNWDSGRLYAVSPCVPSSSTPTPGPVGYAGGEIDTAANACEREIYLFETENHTSGAHSAAKGAAGRTCIVVGGVYDANGNGDFGDDGPATWYRLDFSTGGGAGQKFLDVLRNHKYTFNIGRVSGAGYADSWTAFASAPVNIEAGVVRVDESKITHVAFDPQYMIGVGGDEMLLSAAAHDAPGGDNVLNVITDCPAWKAAVYEDMEGGIELPADGWLRLSKTEGTGTYPTVDNISLLTDANTSGAGRTAWVAIRAGKLTVRVKVTQLGAV